MEKRVYVLYGSQTGNSESIAKDFTENIRAVLPSVECGHLNAFKGVNLKEICAFMIVICSTTGNGDSPENADTWWRSVKLRSAAKDLFAGIEYSVLGLGDTNYDKFCHMGKSIDKRLTELGGVRKIPLFCADEATGLEETVEKWKTAVLDYITQTFLAKSCEEKIDTKIDASTAKLEDVNCECDTPSPCSSQQEAVCDPSAFTSPMEDTLRNILEAVPTNIQSLTSVISLLGQDSQVKTVLETVVTTPTKSIEKLEITILPPSESTSSTPTSSFIIPTIPSIASMGDIRTRSNSEQSLASHGNNTPHSQWTFDHPFDGTITCASWLTSSELSQSTLTEGLAPGEEKLWGETKRVVYAEISFKDAGITYQPGDSIGICAPNLPYAVQIVYNRLQEQWNNDSNEQPLSLKSIVKINASTTEDNEGLPLEEILCYRYDLMGMPKKATVTALAYCCSNDQEKRLMLLLAGKEKLSKLLWTAFIESQALGIADILQLFPSCKPSLNQLISNLSPMPPRYYSIITSPLSSPEKVGIAFSLVRNIYQTSAITTEVTAGLNAKIRRIGVCTSYLEYILAGWLYPCHPIYSNFPKQTTIRIFPKPTLTFHLPASVHPPLILIGPGTGVAPFVSFLDHRYSLEKERIRNQGAEEISSGVWRGGLDLDEFDLPCEGNSVNQFIHSVLPGSIYLFYGCRNSHDYLFQKKLSYFLQEKTLTYLDVAISRPSPSSNSLKQQPQKEYVQHKIEQRAKEVAKLIVEEGAHVYICGDGNQMAKDVEAMLKKIVLDNYGLAAAAESVTPSASCSAKEGATDAISLGGNSLCTSTRPVIDDVNSYFKEMRTRRRYLLDIWS